MGTTRRDVLTSALAATGAALAPIRSEATEHDHDHEHAHEHQAVPSDPALRVKALETLLVAKGAIHPAALDALSDTYEHKVGLAFSFRGGHCPKECFIGGSALRRV
jgi:hypothetical protein